MPGDLHLAVPEPARIRFDGEEVDAASADQLSAWAYSYDTETGVLHLSYEHDRPHEIVVQWG